MSQYTTDFGSIERFDKGRIDVVDDDPRNYVFSNMFEVAATSKPYERVAVAKNFEYVIEVTRAEGDSPWYTAGHDEFAVALDNPVEVHLVKLDDPDAYLPEGDDIDGAHLIAGLPEGRKMGRIVLGRGHMALLPLGAAYRFSAAKAATVMIQTIDGPVTAHKWAEICLK